MHGIVEPSLLRHARPAHRLLAWSHRLLIVVLVGIGLAISTPARVVLISILVPNLATALAAPVLPALGEALVQIGADDALVQLGPANVLHAVERVLVGVVLDEAEATGRLLETVEAHNEAFNLAALAKQLVDLLFGGVEGEIADVERRGVFELVFGLGRERAVQAIVGMMGASALLRGVSGAPSS
jgi:hypothetical protein